MLWWWLQEGQKGVEAKYIQTPEYHEAWKVQARDVLARAEFRKRKLTQRVCSTRSSFLHARCHATSEGLGSALQQLWNMPWMHNIIYTLRLQWVKYVKRLMEAAEPYPSSVCASQGRQICMLCRRLTPACYVLNLTLSHHLLQVVTRLLDGLSSELCICVNRPKQHAAQQVSQPMACLRCS